jgi:hypothetical protein
MEKSPNFKKNINNTNNQPPIESKIKELDLKSLNTNKQLIEMNEDEAQSNSNKIKINEKEVYIENLITKDYEKLLEFISYEEFFYDKMINLQNLYMYLPLSSKCNNSNNLEIFNKYSKEKDEFYNKIGNKFAESQSNKVSVNNQSGGALRSSLPNKSKNK